MATQLPEDRDQDRSHSTTNARPVAVVTGGAGGGIGHGISEAFLAEGWRLVITDRQRPRAEAFLKTLPPEAEVEIVEGDVTQPGMPEKTIAAALARFGRLDALVNNVGVGLTKKAGEVTSEEFYALFNVDFLASFRFVNAALPELVKTQGAIVNIGSVHARLNASKYALYAATKAALEAYTRGLAVDYGRDGVRANTVHPGLVESPQNEALLANLVPNAREWMDEFALKRQCLPRLATPREVGDLVAFLAGPKARSITAQAIFIDGGTTTLLWNNEE